MTAKVLDLAVRVETQNGRFYRVPPDGREYPSVTNTLAAVPKPALVYWSANEERKLVTEAAYKLYQEYAEAEEVALTPEFFRASLRSRLTEERAHQKQLRKAADIGTLAHALIEWDMTGEGERPKAEGPSEIAYQAWQGWRDAVRLEPELVEHTVWSHELETAGTVDLLASMMYGGCRIKAVCDWKTSKALYLEHRLQIAVYRECLIEMGLADADAYGCVLRLSKTKPRGGEPVFEAHVLDPDECSELVDGYQYVRSLWQFLIDEGVKLK